MKGANMQNWIEIEIVLVRDSTKSRITDRHFVRDDWDACEIAAWIEFKSGDLLDDGWKFFFRYVEVSK